MTDVRAALSHHQVTSLIKTRARWAPGAWTPARCALWKLVDADTRASLEMWIDRERERDRCHAAQLPELAFGEAT